MKPQSQLQRTNLVKQFKSLVFIVVFLLVVYTEVIESRFLVKSLPGFVGDLPFTFETGYIGVGDEQWFYYFVESEANPENDPLILWHPAGPGCSGLTNLVSEIGPIIFNQEDSILENPILKINPDRWTKVANFLYIDQPVGTGFSYAEKPEDYITNDTLSTAKAYNFLNKWFVDHPIFVKNPFYIGGYSYNGISVPMIVEEIYKGNEVGEYPQINIKGYILGNPLTDIRGDYNSRIPFAHRVALLSDSIYKSTTANCHGEYLNSDPSNTLCMHDLQDVYKCLNRINKDYILDPICKDSIQDVRNSHIFKRDLISSKESWSLPQFQGKWCRDDFSLWNVWANRIDVREALRISEEYNDEIKWEYCNRRLSFNFEKKTLLFTNNVPSTVSYHKRLTYKKCRALIFSGDHDMIVPYMGTLKWIHSLNLSTVNDWRPWFVNKQVAGYTMKFSSRDYNLTFATVKGGGHGAPGYQPKECSRMFTVWLSNNDL